MKPPHEIDSDGHSVHTDDQRHFTRTHLLSHIDYERAQSQHPAQAMKIHLIGNCQILPLQEILNLVLPEDSVTSSLPVHSISKDEVADLQSSIHQYDVILSQPINSGYRDSIGIDTDSIAKLLDNSRTRLLHFPNVHFEGFHPTWGYMRLDDGSLLRGRVIPEHQNATFQLIEDSDYHDYLLLCCLANNLSVEQTCNVLSNSTGVEATKRWFEQSLQILAQRELACITSVNSLLSSYLENASNTCPMHSYNHPNSKVLTAMALQIADFLSTSSTNDPSDTLRRASLCIKDLNIQDRLGRIRLPIYKNVAASINAAYSMPVPELEGQGTKPFEYLQVNENMLDLTELVSSYFEYYQAIGVSRLMHNLDGPKGALALAIINNYSAVS